MDAEIGVLTSCRSLRVGYQFRFFFSFCDRKQDRICTKISTNHLTVSRLKRCTLYSLFKRRPLNTLCDILKFASTLKLLTLIPPAKTPPSITFYCVQNAILHHSFQLYRLSNDWSAYIYSFLPCEFCRATISFYAIVIQRFQTVISDRKSLPKVWHYSKMNETNGANLPYRWLIWMGTVLLYFWVSVRD